MSDPYDHTPSTSNGSAHGFASGSNHNSTGAGNDNADIDSKDFSMNPPEMDYYAVLNISKSATEEDIKDSYKRLSRIFHPDKHSDPEKKEAAETKFHVINKAFEVLSNPQTRSAYDTFGEEGLNTKWEVGQRLKTPQELRDEFAKLGKEKLEQDLENLVRSKNEITVAIDATRVFKYYEPPTPFGGTQFARKGTTGVLASVARAEIVQLNMKNSFETQFGTGTQLIVGGQMTSRSGMGGGNVVGTIRHSFSQKLQVEVGTSLLNPRIGVFKGTYSFDPLTFITMNAQVRHFNGPPPLNMTFGRRITAGATGYMSYRTGQWAIGSWGPPFERRQDFSSLALGLSGQEQETAYNVEVQTGLMQSHISAEYNWTLADQTKLRVGGNISTNMGISTSIGATRMVTEHTKLGLAVEVGLATGVSLNFQVKRLGQKVTVPIVLSQNFDPKLAFWSVLVPVCSVTAFDLGYLRPRRRRIRKEKIQEMRQVHADFIAKERKEALEAIELLRETTVRKTRQEQEKDGLVIVSAIYGNLEGAAQDPELVVDVTIAVQALVNNSQLSMPGGHSKNHIMGFYDPCLGEKKRLRIRYEFKRRMHEVTVADQAAVMCPLRSHVLE